LLVFGIAIVVVWEYQSVTAALHEFFLSMMKRFHCTSSLSHLYLSEGLI